MRDVAPVRPARAGMLVEDLATGLRGGQVLELDRPSG